MGKISVIQVPSPDPSLVHKPTGLQGEVDRDSCIRVTVRRVEESLRAFRASRMLVGMPRFVFEFRYSGGKTPLIIVTMMFGMFAIASLTWLHRRWISRLHHVEVQRPTSKPCL